MQSTTVNNFLARGIMWNVIGLLGGTILEQAEEIISESLEGRTKKTNVCDRISETTAKVIAILFDVPGMNQGHSRDLTKATPILNLKDGTLIKSYQNVAFDRIFLVDSEENLIFGCFISRIQAKALNEALSKIGKEFT